MSRTANYRLGTHVLATWREQVLSGEPPERFRLGNGQLGRIEFGPGRVVVIGGPPGCGKTGLVCQLVVDALRLNPGLKAVIANCEMPPEALLERQLARISGVPLNIIRGRGFNPEHQERLDLTFEKMSEFADRLTFVGPPFDLANVAGTVDAVQSRFLVVDYLQRILPPGDTNDQRAAVGKGMGLLRSFADQGLGVLAISAVARGKDDRGQSGYSNLNLGSFRESSEIEYAVDDAYLLERRDDQAVLRHVKSRYGEMSDLKLAYYGALQRFEDSKPAECEADSQDRSSGIDRGLAAMFDSTEPADDDEQDDKQDDEPREAGETEDGSEGGRL